MCSNMAELRLINQTEFLRKGCKYGKECYCQGSLAGHGRDVKLRLGSLLDRGLRSVWRIGAVVGNVALMIGVIAVFSTLVALDWLMGK
jgi:hypothetical protein